MATTIRETVLLARHAAYLFERLCDPAAVAARGVLDIGLDTRLLRHEPTARAVRIESVSRIPPGWLPARGLPPGVSAPEVRRDERWQLHGPRLVASWEFSFTGAPAEAHGEVIIDPHPEESPAGTRARHVLEIAVRLPLVGGVVEQALARHLGPAMRRETLALAGEDERPVG